MYEYKIIRDGFPHFVPFPESERAQIHSWKLYAACSSLKM